MNTMMMTRKDLEDLCLAQIKLDIIDLLTYSADLSLMLLDRNMPLDKFRTESFQDDASNLYATARDIGDPLPFSTLVVYICALTDILEERLKD